MTGNLVRNEIETPDGTLLTSRHTNDCKVYKDKNGFTYMNDGGLGKYVRRYAHDQAPYTDRSIFDDDDFEIVRTAFEWNIGDSEEVWLSLAELSTQSIIQILSSGSRLEYFEALFLKELEVRNELHLLAE